MSTSLADRARDVDEDIAEVWRRVSNQKLEVALVGNHALWMLSGRLAVASVDEHPSSWPVVRWARSGVPCSTVQLFSGRRVDWFVGGEGEYRDLYVEAVERSVEVGLLVRVVRPEHLVAIKMAEAQGRQDEMTAVLQSIGSHDRCACREVVRRHLGRYAASVFDFLSAEQDRRALERT